MSPNRIRVKGNIERSETHKYQLSKRSPPIVVLPVSTLSSYIHAFAILTKFQTPPLRPMNPKDTAIDLYGFVDALG